jgi:hypothetical protein
MNGAVDLACLTYIMQAANGLAPCKKGDDYMSHSTINELREVYLKDNRRIKWSTAQLTDRAFRYLSKAIGDMELRYMTIEHAEQFQLWLLNRYSKTSANMYLKIIRPAFRYAPVTLTCQT